MKRFFLISVGILILMFAFQGCKPRKVLTKDEAVLAPGPKIKSGVKLILSDASTLSTHSRTPQEATLIEYYAEFLDISSKKIANPRLYSFMNEWMGVPHRDRGTNQQGVDCSAFIGLLYDEVYQKQIPRTAAQMSEQVKRKYENQLQEGDLVFFSFGTKRVDHVGVYLHNGFFAHVSSSRGVIISRLKDSWYYRFFVRAGAI